MADTIMTCPSGAFLLLLVARLDRPERLLLQSPGHGGTRAGRSSCLLERGNAALKEEQWIRAREFFTELLNNYPQSPVRADAKLALGDAYLGEDTAASLVYAQNEYREFLSFYPTSNRADYAQMQLGMVHYNQMLNPQRDQTRNQGSHPRIPDLRGPVSQQPAGAAR